MVNRPRSSLAPGPEVTLRIIHQLVLGLLCLVVCTGVYAGQSVGIVSGTSGPPAEGRSIVQGKVIQEPGGQGIRKVKVTLAGGLAPNHEPYQTTTDETGQFKIEGVAPGPYLVTLERAGFASDGKEIRERTVKVTDGQDTKDLIFHMLMAGVITGKIVDTDGDPLRGVGVAATARIENARRNLGAAQSGTTNDLGEYRIADLPPGKYVVQANPPQNEGPLPSPNEKGVAKERLIYVETYFPGTLDKRQAAAVEVPAGGTATANFGVQASRAYRVSGTVTGLGDNRMTGMFLIGRNGQTEQQNLAEGGRFEFSRVLPGTYKAQILSVSGWANGPMPSMKVLAISTPIEVNESDLLDLQLQVEPGGDVSGRLRMDGDEKVNFGELFVTLRPLANGEEEASLSIVLMGQAAVAKVSEDGSFEIKDAPGIDCQLEIGTRSDKFRDYYTKSVLLGGREVADTGFTVNAGTRLDVVVSAKGAAIEGTVVDGDGKPVPSAVVVTVPASGKLGRPDAYQIGGTDDSGHFNLRGMNPGEFVVLAFGEMPANHHSPEFAKKYEAKGERVALEEAAKKTVVLKLIKEDDGQQ
jgi:Carboxypeptidase regulatory-like domain